MGGVLDKQDQSDIKCSYFLHLKVILTILIHVAETQKSKMVLICPYYKTKKTILKKWVDGVTQMHQILFDYFFD